MNRKYFFYLHIFIGLMAPCILKAQQRPVFSQYMFNQLNFNPAYAARHQYTLFNVAYRDQWVNFPGAPKTLTFTAQSGFKERRLGVGMTATSDKQGVHNNTSVYFSYGYKIPLSNKNFLALGIQGGFDVLKSDWTLLSLPDYAQHDPLLSGVETTLYPNFGTGLYFYNEKFYIGLSVPYILGNYHKNTSDVYESVRHSRNYYLTSGILFNASGKVVIKPSFLVRLEENMPVAYDLNCNIFYDEFAELGFSYRSGGSIIGLLGFQATKYLKFTYAYDWIISDISQYSGGSHELALQYRINFSAPKKHRMCPGPLYF